MKLIKVANNRLNRVRRKMNNSRELSRISNEDNAPSQLLFNAIKSTLENSLNAEEKACIDRIESLRQELNNSSTEITVVDYGAGGTDLNITAEEMYKGRIATKAVGGICRKASKPYLQALLLFKLIKEFRPLVCLEMGTCLGISASYQAMALKINKQGKIITLEGSESLSLCAQQNFQRLDLDNVISVVGRFNDTLAEVLNEHRRIDYAFIDGHHEECATLDYFEQIFPFLSKNAVLIFDDISWSHGMKRAWSTLIKDERVQITVDLIDVGICIVDNRLDKRQSYRMILG